MKPDLFTYRYRKDYPLSPFQSIPKKTNPNKQTKPNKIYLKDIHYPQSYRDAYIYSVAPRI